jgi:hypothetical protein
VSATKLVIYQETLRLFGDARIALLTDDVAAVHAMDDAYPGAVDFCLRQAAWRFALKAVEISPIVGDPTPGFSVLYAIPSDWLRTHAYFVLSGAIERPVDVREQGRSINANVEEGLFIRYVSFEFADPELAGHPWPEHFTKLVCAYLAFQVAERITNSAAAAARMSDIFSSVLPVAMAHDALPENPWLRHQLDGSFAQGVLYVLSQGYWSFALKTIEFFAAQPGDPPFAVPIIGYPFSYEQPDDMVRSHALFVVAGDGRELPVDVKEDGRQWSTTSNQLTVRYVSEELGSDTVEWPECFAESVKAYLQVKDGTGDKQSSTGQPIPAAGVFRNVLAAALAIEAETEHPWYRFQRSGAFLRACFHVAESGRWKFAINTLRLTADATINADGTLSGTLPQNSMGDPGTGTVSISPSYSAVFAKPADWLRTIWVYRTLPGVSSTLDWSGYPERDDIDFRDENGAWHANHRQIEVRYIRRAAIDSIRWPQSYANAVLAWCEYDEVRNDPRQAAVATAKQKIYEDMVNKAESRDDDQERAPYRHVGRVVRGRFSRGRGHGEFGLRH